MPRPQAVPATGGRFRHPAPYGFPMSFKNPILGLCQQATFLISAAKVDQCPEDSGLEVAFAGRSNAGKSSALNTLTHASLARTSKTPGRTQLLNFFRLDDERRLVDLPGYGYAAITVAFLGRLHPLGIVFASLLMALLYLGGENAQMAANLPQSITQLFQGMVLFFLLACDVLILYRPRFARSLKRKAGSLKSVTQP